MGKESSGREVLPEAETAYHSWLGQEAGRALLYQHIADEWILSEEGRMFSCGALSYPLEEVPDPPAGTSLLFQLGVAEGHEGEGWRHWFAQGGTLYILEEEVALLRAFLQTKSGASLLSHPQVHLLLMSETHLLDRERASLLFRPMQTLAPPHRKSLDERGVQRMEEEVLKKLWLGRELTRQQLLPRHHFYHPFFANLPLLPESCRIEGFFSSCVGIPAVLCGGGPSLIQALPFLEQLGERALILAGGSALPALQQAGKRPHFAAALSPSSSEARLIGATDELPLLYTARLFPPLLEAHRGARFYLPTSGTPPLARWLEEEAGLGEVRIPAGLSVTTLLLEWAFYLGCSPLFLVGVDLKVEKGRSYAGEFSHTHELFSDLYTHGSGEQTRPTWLLEGESLIGAARQRGVPLLRVPGGLSFLEIEEVEIEEFLNRWQPIEGLDERVREWVAGAEKVGHLAEILRGLQEVRKSGERMIGEWREDPLHPALFDLACEEELMGRLYLRPLQEAWKGAVSSFPS